VHLLASTNQSWWQPRECGPEASKNEMDLGFSGTLISNSSKPAGFRPNLVTW